MSRVFVTGGSGSIGRRLVRRLVDEGHEVSGLVRSEESAALLAAAGATPVLGELTDAGTWQDALAGHEVVFHLAAETDIDADRERHQLVTVVGTEQALRAARAAGVPVFVHCGSESALLAGEPLVEVDETAPLRPDSAAAYCAAKADAERLVLEADTLGFRTVSVRPRFVWGPESSLIENLAGAARAGAFGWIEGGRFTTDVTYVDNAVEGLVLGWHRGRGGEAYFVTDRHRVVLRDFLEAQFAAHGVTEEIVDLDAATAEAVVPVPARWFIGQDCTLRTDKAVAELRYAPLVDQATGLERVRASLA
ncbi:NAD-dependent epimerase/dehydratase family protein [Nocardioides anomalus]|uniref:NAD-dependent epimerase/dehydratase family protein n=1 Tax=Nocardioides anomalus TaxID=2712223 RepID=A0A6G6W8M3_9ACTN|nr:NAD-dependent epimerase/dehydratase family protein [Nocardioides anomalus]QIG41688.1 NAD-dependent epimerase/dehydratase family protein [Nocardioides anomalus]